MFYLSVMLMVLGQYKQKKGKTMEWLYQKDYQEVIKKHEKVEIYDWALDTDMNPDFSLWEKEIKKYLKKTDRGEV